MPTVSVLICRDHGDRWRRRGDTWEEWRGDGSARKAGRGKGVHAALVLPLWFSHLSALIPDRWREGRDGAKRLSPQAGRAGGGCFVSMVCVGREAAGGLAAWPPWSLFPRNLGVGSTWMLWGRKAGKG